MRKPSRRQIERDARKRAAKAWGFAVGCAYASIALLFTTGLVGWATTL
jgi:hypothetical protein